MALNMVGLPCILKSAADNVEDHSFSHHDCLPYYLRIGDKWTPIDYSKHPSHWMKPLEPGPATGLVEIPSNWYLDDVGSPAFISCVYFMHTHERCQGMNS